MNDHHTPEQLTDVERVAGWAATAFTSGEKTGPKTISAPWV